MSLYFAFKNGGITIAHPKSNVIFGLVVILDAPQCDPIWREMHERSTGYLQNFPPNVTVALTLERRLEAQANNSWLGMTKVNYVNNTIKLREITCLYLFLTTSTN